MKKTFLYLFSAFMMGISLSSCLGDTGANTAGSDFAMIHESNDNTPMFAWIAGGGLGLSLTWTGISSEYTPGDLLYLSYDVDLSNQSGGVITTDKSNIQVVESYRTQDQKRFQIGEGVADTSLVNNEHQFEALQLRLQYIQEIVFKDRWIFTARVKLKEGQIMDPQFFYDTRPEMQHTSTGAALEDAIVIDVRLNIKNEGDGTAASQDKTFVVDFSQIRNQIFNSQTEDKKVYKIWLRYYDSNKSKEKPTYVSAGTLMHTASSTTN